MKRVTMVVLIGLAVIGAVLAGTRPEDMTREEKNKLLVKAANEARNAGDWEELKKLYSPEFIQHIPSSFQTLTWKEIVPGWKYYHDKVPTLKIQIVDIIAEGNKVAVRLRWTAWNKRYYPKLGNLVGWIEGNEIDMFRIEDGKFVEQWVAYDPTEIMKVVTYKKFMGTW